MKITVTQTRQFKQYEPRKIEIEIDTIEEKIQGDYEVFIKNLVDSIDRVLYPENYQSKDDDEF